MTSIGKRTLITLRMVALTTFTLLTLLPGPATGQASEWEWQNPLPQGNPLHGVWGSSGNDVFAVGAAGTILHYDGHTWTIMNSGTNSLLSDVWGSSGNDVFAVGAAGTILHYDGHTWTIMNSDTDSGLYGVWGSSGQDVFAVGYKDDYNGTILHYDGHTWLAMDGGVLGRLNDVWGSSGNDVFAVGYNMTPILPCWPLRAPCPLRNSGTILHYDGHTWTTMTTMSDWDRESRLLAVWGSSSSDVFAVGYYSMMQGTILHYNGSTWGVMDGGNRLTGVWGSNGNNVFAVGYSYPTESGPIRYYDGSAWATIDSVTSGSFDDVWGSSGDDVFAVGGASILHYNGSTWTDMTTGTHDLLNSVWGSSSNDVFAVGYGSLTGSTETEYRSIQHYDGHAWTVISSTERSNRLNSVWGSSGNDVFAVGDGGTILHYDGSAWETMNGGMSDWLYDVWGNSDSDVFAVGYSGSEVRSTILHYDGNSWTAMNNSIPRCWLNAVWGSSSNDVFAVGYTSIYDGTREHNYGTILHYDGSTWTAMSSITDTILTDVWGSSGSDIFAVGYTEIYSGTQVEDYGTILHYDGSTWAEMNSGTNNRLTGVWGSSSSDVFAVGEYGTILHYDGSTWAEMNSRTSNYLTGMWGSSGSDVFAVGGGTILHYPRNTAPVANDDQYDASEDTLLNVPAPGVLGNDSDLEGNNLVITGSSPPVTGTIILPVYGTLTLNTDGGLSYQSNANFCGQDRFTYHVSDNHGGTATARLTFQVACVNDPPYLGAVTGVMQTSTTISVTVPFSDPDSGDSFVAVWDWGDGATSPGSVAVTTGLVTGSHRYDKPGIYTVQLVLVDQAGARSNEAAHEFVIGLINSLYLPLVKQE